MRDFANNYLIYKLFLWKSQFLDKSLESVSFTRVELMKLIFFVSAVKNEMASSGDLLDMFNEFYAMALGPVEMSIYRDMLDGLIPCCQAIDERRIIMKEGYQFELPDIEENQMVTDAIDRSIDRLKEINPKIIGYTAARLVDISHLWRCWIVAMSIAKLLGKSSYKMNPQSIRNSNQFFGYE